MPVNGLIKQVATTSKSSTFPKGKSGNPAGRPVGSGDAAKLRAAISDGMDDVVAVVLKKAKTGCMTAAGLLLARCLPPLRPADTAVAIKLGKGSLTDQSRRVAALMASGDVSMGQGSELIGSLAVIAKMRGMDELVAQVDAMEKELREIRNAVTRKND